MKKTLKSFYKRFCPGDPCADYMSDTATFSDLLAALMAGRNVYDVIGVGDSVIRSALFERLAALLSVDYDVIYNAWLRV